MASKKKKKKVPKHRNPFVLPARSKKGGPHKNKKDKRAKEHKGHKKYLDENH